MKGEKTLVSLPPNETPVYGLWNKASEEWFVTYHSYMFHTESLKVAQAYLEQVFKGNPEWIVKVFA